MERYKNKQYPQEHFVPFESDDYLLGRLTLNLAHDGLSVEIDIVQKETRKIWRSVDRLYRLNSDDDAVELGRQRLADYLNSLR